MLIILALIVAVLAITGGVIYHPFLFLILVLALVLVAVDRGRARL